MTIVFFFVANGFFINTWEEYYTGSLDLPIIHGVSEGCVLSCILMIISGYCGQNIWLNVVSIGGFSITINHLAAMICFIAAQIFVVGR